MDAVSIVGIIYIGHIVDVVHIADIVDNMDLVDICVYSGTLLRALLYYVSGALAYLNMCVYFRIWWVLCISRILWIL